MPLPAPGGDAGGELDLRLRQRAGRLFDDFVGFAEDARAAIDQKVYEKFGYADPQPYFDERIGVSYRTLHRYLTIVDALYRLPLEEQAAARPALRLLGVHKAGVLAPVVGRASEDWRLWVDRAQTDSVDALQEAVSLATGAKPRGATGEPGERFWRQLLNAIPPEERARAEWVFGQLGRIAGGTGNAVGIFLVLLDLGEQELAAHGLHRA